MSTFSSIALIRKIGLQLSVAFMLAVCSRISNHPCQGTGWLRQYLGLELQLQRNARLALVGAWRPRNCAVPGRSMDNGVKQRILFRFSHRGDFRRHGLLPAAQWLPCQLYLTGPHHTAVTANCLRNHPKAGRPHQRWRHAPASGLSTASRLSRRSGHQQLLHH